MKNIFGLFISFFVVFQSGYGVTVKDSIPTNKIVASKYNNDFTSLDSVAIDTTLKRFQIYSYPFKNRALPVFLGNPGLPFTSVLYSDRRDYPDFLFSHYADYDFHKPEDIIYYKTRSPYTQLSYFTSGPKSRQEQNLNLIHTQNINKDLNVSFLGDLNYSDGRFVNQRARLSAFSLSANYTGQRYRIYGSVNSNSLKFQENGGVQNDTLLRSISNPVSVPVNLEAANTILKNQSVFVFHRFYITGSYKSDSLHNSSKWNEVISLIHSFKYDRNYKSFTDQLTYQHQSVLASYDSSFYRNVFIDSTDTYDSVYLRRIDNTLQLAINTNQWLKVPAELRFGIKNQIDRFSFGMPINQDSTGGVMNNYGRKQDDYNNTALVASLTNRFSKTIQWGASVEQYFTGFKAGDLTIIGDIEKSIWGNFILKASGKLASIKPGYFINEYSSNHFNWNNSFGRQKSTSVRAGLFLKKLKFSIEAQSDNLFGYVYFDSLAMPRQTSLQKGFTVSSLTVNKLVDWGIFHTDIRLTYQLSGNKEVISLPTFSGFNSTYLELELFKKVLKFQLGFDVFYNSPFYADAYMPATGMFHRQNKIKINDHPFTNVFLNIKIKRLRFFLEYERIDWFIDSNYGFFLPHYHYNPGILKYGLSWTFYD